MWRRSAPEQECVGSRRVQPPCWRLREKKGPEKCPFFSFLPISGLFSNLFARQIWGEPSQSPIIFMT
jgi:hypothetical protein